MTKIFGYFIIVAITITGYLSCKKTGTDTPPETPPATTSYVQFAVNGIQFSGEQLYALVSIKKASGEEVVSNKKLTINYIQGVYKTDKIQFEKAAYKLSKFIVLAASDSAVYATPLSNTPKASMVTKPIDIAFAVSQPEINEIPVEVLKIFDTHAPADYGYTDADFGFVTYKSVKVKLKINVGEVAYDSLPGKLKVTAFSNQGAQWSREITMHKGLTHVRVPEQFIRYTFEVEKWNAIAAKTVAGAEMQPGMLVELEAARTPKRLLEEASFIEASGNFNPETRTEYFYNTAGRLSDIKDYQKSVQVNGLPLSNIYSFKYANALLDSIYRYSPENNSTGYTAFFYNGGKLSNIYNKSYDQETGADIEYENSNGLDKIKVDYKYHNGSSVVYTMNFIDGNKISDKAEGSNNGGEAGTYEYDDNINPKFLLGYPNLYFTNSSKNNLVREQKNYSGSIPQVVPYKFEYIYDGDGYPVEVYISYKGYTSNQHLYRIKKTYKYQ